MGVRRNGRPATRSALLRHRDFLRTLTPPESRWSTFPHRSGTNGCGALTSERVTWPASLRLIVIGSDRASAESLATWRRHSPEGLRLLNAYGTAETTITSLVADLVPPLDEPRRAAVAIGRPILNTQAYVLDSRLEPVPVGVFGELCIGGAGLARDYLNDRETTAKKFVAHPFDRSPHARLFRTGDLARYRADGNIEYLGRVDDQVKIRGTRVEPAEVESALRQHETIRAGRRCRATGRGRQRPAGRVHRFHHAGGRYRVAALSQDETARAVHSFGIRRHRRAAQSVDWQGGSGRRFRQLE